VQGDLRAIGTIDELIASAGRHYSLRVSFELGDGDIVVEQVVSFAPHAVVQRQFDRSATFAIAKSSGNTVCMSVAFPATHAGFNFAKLIYR
jgi:hypothetical protein